MKKPYFIAILTIGILIVAYVVTYFYNKQNIELSILGDDDVMISIQDEVVLESTEVILITIENTNIENLIFGLDYEIQIKDNDMWLQYYSPENIDDPIIYLTKGERYEQKIYLADSMNLKANEIYRIVKIINNKAYTSNNFLLK